MRNLLTLGRHAFNGSAVMLRMIEVFVHWMIVGGSGKGKSRLLAAIVRFCIDWRIPVIVLDPGGDLYRWSLAYAALSGNASRVVAMDMNDQETSFGFDMTRCYGVSPYTIFDQFFRGLGKVYGQPDESVQPLLETWTRNVVVPLIQCPGATLADMREFASLGRSILRNAILEGAGNDLIRREWEAFEALKTADQQHLVMSVHNRAAKLTIPDEMRRMIGQDNPPFDIGEAIEQRKIMLANLAPEHVSKEQQRMAAITLINQIGNYAPRRSLRQRCVKTLVICDEANLYASDELPTALDTLRKNGIFFVMCFQHLAQAEKIPGYLDSLFSNTDVRVAFRTSRRDAEELVGELFPDGLTRREVKDEITHTAWDPIESTRTVRSRTSASGVTTSRSESSGFASGSGRGGGASFGFNEPNYPDLFAHGSSSQMYSNSSFDSQISSSSNSAGYSKSKSESHSETVVPFYEYLARTEVSSRTFYSVEELRERYISWFLMQPMRHAQVKIGDRPTVPIITEYVPDTRARERDIHKVTSRSNQKYALPAKEVDRMINERRKRLLAGYEQRLEEKEAAESANSRWH